MSSYCFLLISYNSLEYHSCSYEMTKNVIIKVSINEYLFIIYYYLYHSLIYVIFTFLMKALLILCGVFALFVCRACSQPQQQCGNHLSKERQRMGQDTGADGAQWTHHW